MAIPGFDANGNLPEGEHDATFVELTAQFGYNPKRRQILDGLREVVKLLEQRNVSHIWIDGSFVTSKLKPKDVDVIYEPPRGEDVNSWGLLSPPRRTQLKDIYKVDLIPYPSPQRHPLQPFRSVTIVGYFSIDRDGNDKGIITFSGWA